MSSPYLERKIMESVQEKKKYFQKTLSLSAVDANYQRILDTEDYFTEWAWREMPLFIWLDISSLFIFGLDPTELEPFTLDFRVELPSFEEWMQGIKLWIYTINLGDLWSQMNADLFNIEVPPVLDFDTFIDENVTPEIAPDVKQQKERKLTVGVTKYGEGYVDPPVIREFLRSTFYELFRRRPDYERLRTIFKVIAEKLGVAESVVEAVFNRIVLHEQMFYENFILGYNLLGVSKLTPRGSDKASLTIINWRGEEQEVRYTKFAENNNGFILGVTPLGYGLLTPRERFFKESPRGITPKIVWFIDYKARRLLARYRATHLMVANYQRVDEMIDYTRSERTEQYHALAMRKYYIESLIDALLQGYGVDNFKRNLYRKAVLQLIGHKKKRHRWGYAAFKSMTEDEFKEWWLGHWERQGLNRSLLEKIYERVKRWLPRLRSDLEELGERLRKRRRALARALAS
ncbi:MAG: hypothetical protein DRJ67_01115 [Thermoprotei archaeon]|nr:MAG: hypothetical protein DRJ67_01115 [Thermoprotei archaeon]